MKAGDIVIVVASAGWVFVGTISDASTSQHTVLDRASVVRRWGTSKGLGELAMRGPLAHTVLDPIGMVWIEHQHVLFSIPCKEPAWKGKLP